jgi:hypothetical protein
MSNSRSELEADRAIYNQYASEITQKLKAYKEQEYNAALKFIRDNFEAVIEKNGCNAESFLLNFKLPIQPSSTDATLHLFQNKYQIAERLYQQAAALGRGIRFNDQDKEILLQPKGGLVKMFSFITTFKQKFLQGAKLVAECEALNEKMLEIERKYHYERPEDHDLNKLRL